MNTQVIKKEKWIVDTDPGIDDMMALLYLLNRPDAEVLMISLVDGNVSLEYVSQNSRKILKMADKSIPLYRGSDCPIVREFSNEESYHYSDGLGDIEEVRLFDANDIQIEKENSIIKIIEYIEKYPNEINLLCLGPLTNIAAAYMLNPDIVDKLKCIHMMGGSTHSKGNIIPPSEFNWAYDFIAAKMVVSNFSNIIITPWESTEELIIKDHMIREFSENIKGKNKILNEIIFNYVFLIISKFTLDKNGTQLCDLYSVISAFEKKCVAKSSLCDVDVIIDTLGMLGMLHVKSRTFIRENFENFNEEFKNNKDLQTNLKKNGRHIIIEEFNELHLFEEYEKVFIKY